MRSCTSATSSPCRRTYIAPSPSTRASTSVRISRAFPFPSTIIRALRLVRPALLPELGPRRVDLAEGTDQVGIAASLPILHPTRQRAGVGCIHRAEAAVPAAVVGGTEGAAAGVGHRAQAGGAVSDHDADVAAPLALDADAVFRQPRPPAGREGCDHLEQLPLVDRTSL